MDFVIANERARSILLALAVLVVFFLFNQTFLDNNDFMYSAAPVVWAENGALYSNVPFVQAPLTIFLNYGLMSLLSPERLFVASRLLSMLLVLGAILLAAFALRKSKDPRFVLMFVMICLTNTYILSNSAEIGSYAQPLFLTAAALAAPTLGLRPQLAATLVGLLLGLAVTAKLNFLLVFPAFLVLLLLKTERSWRVVVWCAAGAALGASPLAYYVSVDFPNLFRRLVRFHYLTLEARGLDPTRSASQILTELAEMAKTMAVPIGLLAARLALYPKAGRGRERLLAFAFIVCGVAMGVAARTVYIQYLAPLVLFLLFFCFPDREDPFERKNVLWLVGAAFFAIQFSALLVETAQRVLSEKGLAMQDAATMQRKASAIAATMNKCDRRLYSSQPLFLLSNDVKYPPELGAGPFLLALRGGRLKPEDIGVDIDARLAKWVPNVVIYGFYAGQNNNFSAVDDKVQAYAQAHDFETTTLGSVTNRTVVIAFDKACV